jgi:transposase
MTNAETTALAIKLLQERSRDALLDGLGLASAQLGQDEMLAFMADLLLAAGADRDHIKARLVALLSARYGRSSEQASSAQLQLFAELLKRVAGETASPSPEPSDDQGPSDKPEPTPAAMAAKVIQQTNEEIASESVAQRVQRKAARDAILQAQRLAGEDGSGSAVPWPTHLPVREETLPIPDAELHCEDCGEERRVIRTETSWRMEYKTTAEVVVTRIPVLACASHHGGPVTLAVPPKPVDKGQMGFSLAARVLWLRTTHNLPVRRISEMMQAEGVPVTEEMTHTLICESGERLKPVAEAIHKEVQDAILVNLDDTPVDVLDDVVGKKERTTRKAHVWIAIGDERFAYFFATKSWKAAEAEKELGTIKGTLQGDGYKGFPKYAEGNAKQLAGCMAHLRRKLHKAVLAHDPRAVEAMALVQGLYRVEELSRLRNLDEDALLALRQERSVPIWNALIFWAKVVEPTIETGSTLGKAWTYLSNQRKPLEVFLNDGTVSIDNNAAERGLRRITIGRKLWLFFRDQTKLEHVTRLMSVATTARLHGVDELAYLTWLLEQVAIREWSAEAARKLLPAAWMALQKQPAEERGT